MQTASNGGGGAIVTPFNRTAATAPGVAPPPTPVTWRTPGIFQLIQAAGQTVVTVSVINVQADYGPVLGGQNGGWASTGITGQPGQKIWIDTQAGGMWGDHPDSEWDANGKTLGMGDTGPWRKIDTDLWHEMLIGYVGAAPILPYGHMNGEITGDPRFIPSGNTLLNFPINFSGPISLANNDNQNLFWYLGIPGYGLLGSQQVRVIITQ
jgi:hypothetical protein